MQCGSHHSLVQGVKGVFVLCSSLCICVVVLCLLLLRCVRLFWWYMERSNTDREEQPERQGPSFDPLHRCTGKPLPAYTHLYTRSLYTRSLYTRALYTRSLYTFSKSDQNPIESKIVYVTGDVIRDSISFLRPQVIFINTSSFCLPLPSTRCKIISLLFHYDFRPGNTAAGSSRNATMPLRNP